MPGTPSGSSSRARQPSIVPLITTTRHAKSGQTSTSSSCVDRGYDLAQPPREKAEEEEQRDREAMADQAIIKIKREEGERIEPRLRSSAGGIPISGPWIVEGVNEEFDQMLPPTRKRSFEREVGSTSTSSHLQKKKKRAEGSQSRAASHQVAPSETKPRFEPASSSLDLKTDTVLISTLNSLKASVDTLNSTMSEGQADKRNRGLSEAASPVEGARNGKKKRMSHEELASDKGDEERRTLIDEIEQLKKQFAELVEGPGHLTAAEAEALDNLREKDELVKTQQAELLSARVQATADSEQIFDLMSENRDLKLRDKRSKEKEVAAQRMMKDWCERIKTFTEDSNKLSSSWNQLVKPSSLAIGLHSSLAVSSESPIASPELKSGGLHEQSTQQGMSSSSPRAHSSIPEQQPETTISTEGFIWPNAETLEMILQILPSYEADCNRILWPLPRSAHQETTSGQNVWSSINSIIPSNFKGVIIAQVEQIELLEFKSEMEKQAQWSRLSTTIEDYLRKRGRDPAVLQKLLDIEMKLYRKLKRSL